MSSSTAIDLSKPIPSPAEVGEGIVDLTNRTFERVQARLDMFAADPRRVNEDGRLGLSEQLDSMMYGPGPDRRYGRVALYAANQESVGEIQSILNGDIGFIDSFRGPFGPSHAPLVEPDLRAERDKPERYTPAGRFFVFQALRDVYPYGYPEKSLMADGRETDELRGLWGERHKIGIRIISLYEDLLAPSRPATWDFTYLLQSRFDKEEPEKKVTSRFDGLVDSRDLGLTTGDFSARASATRRATNVDLNLVSSLLSAAKDLRPAVQPIGSYVRSAQALQELFERFFGKSSAYSGSEEPVGASTSE